LELQWSFSHLKIKIKKLLFMMVSTITNEKQTYPMLSNNVTYTILGTDFFREEKKMLKCILPVLDT